MGVRGGSSRRSAARASGERAASERRRRRRGWGDAWRAPRVPGTPPSGTSSTRDHSGRQGAGCELAVGARVLPAARTAPPGPLPGPRTCAALMTALPLLMAGPSCKGCARGEWCCWCVTPLPLLLALASQSTQMLQRSTASSSSRAALMKGGGQRDPSRSQHSPAPKRALFRLPCIAPHSSTHPTPHRRRRQAPCAPQPGQLTTPNSCSFPPRLSHTPQSSTLHRCCRLALRASDAAPPHSHPPPPSLHGVHRPPPRRRPPLARLVCRQRAARGPADQPHAAHLPAGPPR